MRTKHKNIGELKKKALTLRLKGASYPEIEKQLSVNRSTLSGWLGKILLSKSAVIKIQKRKMSHLANARILAVASNRKIRLRAIKEQRNGIFKEFADKQLDKSALEFVLAALYLGEGVKIGNVLSLANSNPKIVLSFVNLVRRIYHADEDKFRCYLHLRMDQNDLEEKDYWSNALSVPISKFRKSQFDRRTLGKKTHLGYHGVCAAYYYDALLARRMAVLQEYLLDKILTGV